MGKLNYAARKTEGTKAGQIVSKDLRKKIPPGIGSKAAARDPYLEIDLTGKGLTDEGFAEFIDDLIACLDFRGDDHPGGAVRLTELSLKGNKLTAASLEKLGKVIARSHDDLRDLDISENQITINNLEHADIWKGFLDSFQGCYVLKRIDFSGNEIGARGFELLCRAYMQSDLDFVEPIDGDAAVNGDDEQIDTEPALHETMNTLSIGSNKENVKASPDHTKGGKSKAARAVRTGSLAASAALSPAEVRRFACTRGLRSVAYLIFTNMGLTNACSFHLSVILLSHRLPEALLAFLPSGKSVGLTDYDNRCKGIIYLPNENLERAAKRLIELAEINRQEVLETESAESDSDASQSPVPGHHSPYVNWGRERGTKRRETRKQHQTILERAKKLLLLDVLKSDGLHSTELWSVAFQMVVVSRAILLEDKSRGSTQAEEDKGSKENPATEVSKELIVSKSLSSGHFEENNPPHLFAPGRDDFDINFPAIQKSIQMPTTPVKRAIAPSIPEGTSRQGKKKPHGNNHGRPSTTGTSNASKEEVGRFGWPLEVWRVIIAKAVGAEGILSTEQQMNIIRYASDWNSLGQELSVQGAAENQQIWKILETVGCLAYTAMQ